MVFQPTVLLVTDAVALPATAILWALSTFEDKVEGGNRLAVITQASQLGGNLKFETSSVDAIFSLGENSGFNSVPWLSDLARILKPGGVLVVQEPQTGDKQTKSALERSLLLAGYMNSQQCPAYTKSGESSVAVRALKTTWEIGMSFAIKKKTIASQDSSLKSNGTTLKLSTDEVDDVKLNGPSIPFSNGTGALKLPTFEDDADFELVDEDSLLTEEDMLRPELPKVDDDCEVGQAGRKACKNCTCGRAQMEEAEKRPLTVEELNNPQSACGNCGLGDAFRCSGCPYKGLPAFKLGEKITLSGTLLTADV